MELTYLLLLASVIGCFVFKKNISIILLISSIITAYINGIIDYRSLLVIVVLYIMSHIYFQNNIASKAIRLVALVITLIATALLSLHMIPGFNNILAIDNILVSPLSTAFSMYLNFDKTLVGVILFINSNLYNKEKLDVKSLIITFKFLLLCSLTLMVAGLIAGYIKFDFKIPNILFIWSINNLFFVCFAEEVIFRGIIQNKLEKLFSNKYLSLISTSIIFGLAHFKGGIEYILLASIAGGFYGFTYQKTGRILYPMLVHFGLNLIHLIFFTYPAAIKIMS